MVKNIASQTEEYRMTQRTAVNYFLTAFIIWMAASTMAYAQQTRLKVQSKECMNGFCQQVTGYGGCVYIGNAPNGNWIFATAAHNLRNAYDVRVMLDAEWKIASIVKSDPETDAALIVTFPGNQQLKCHHFGENTRQDEVIMLRGLLHGTSKRSIKGTALTSNVLRMKSSVIQGDSGCPVFRQNGELVGIQSAKDRGNIAYIVPASAYRAMISKRWGKLTCLRLRAPVVVRNHHCPTCDCRQKFSALQMEISSLKQQIARLQTEKPQVDLTEIESRLRQLEPLLNRRLQLLNADGKVTADRIYKPNETMKIRGIYKSK